MCGSPGYVCAKGQVALGLGVLFFFSYENLLCKRRQWLWIVRALQNPCAEALLPSVMLCGGGTFGGDLVLKVEPP